MIEQILVNRISKKNSREKSNGNHLPIGVKYNENGK
jgi:hypothetical protein